MLQGPENVAATGALGSVPVAGGAETIGGASLGLGAPAGQAGPPDC